MKFNCFTCPFWVYAAEIDDPNAKPSVIAGAPVKKIRVGWCYFSRPNAHFVPAQSAVAAPGTMTIEQRQYRVTVREDDFCGEHPDFKLAFAIKTAQYIASVKPLDYDPGKFSDTGFNRPPTLAEAKDASRAKYWEMHTFEASAEGSQLTGPYCAVCGQPEKDPRHAVKA